MMQTVTRAVLALFALLPLPCLQWLGALLGRITCATASETKAITLQNVYSSKLAAGDQEERQLVRAVFEETMKGALELTVAWTRSSAHIASLFKEVHGWEHVERAVADQKGLLLLTPHLGNYDLAGRYISTQLPFPLTAMYRPPKIRWLEGVMNAGRIRDNGRTAPANQQGVRQIVRALRSKEAVVVLPDQVPRDGEGVWVDFFGRPAYTMTLAARLTRLQNVTTLMFCGIRLPHGKGFSLHIVPLSAPLTGDIARDTRLINRDSEALIARFPAQYLFAYNRYKGTPPAQTADSAAQQPPA